MGLAIQSQPKLKILVSLVVTTFDEMLNLLIIVEKKIVM